MQKSNNSLVLMLIYSTAEKFIQLFGASCTLPHDNNNNHNKLNDRKNYGHFIYGPYPPSNRYVKEMCVAVLSNIRVQL